MKKFLAAVLALGLAVFPGCSQNTETENIETGEVSEKTEAAENQKEESSSSANEEKEQKEVLGKIEVINGAQLERDIIPEISEVYGITEEEVKEVFSNAESELISPEAEGFRKMEGMISPGEHDITEESLNEQMKKFIDETEKRYSDIEAAVTNLNSLTAQERIVLASVIEAECLGGEHRQETADVFLNRLSEGSKLQSCVTAEYALGYQRPYLTYDDTEIESGYNTYYSEGLPAGPIGSFSDESLKAASGKSTDESLKYFFYDYVTGDMHFYSDFGQFNSDGVVTMERFKAESPVGEFDKINKQELYGK